jgi:hypothetical protein
LATRCARVTLKDRTSGPAVERFVACARDVACAMDEVSPSRKSRAMRTRETGTGKANEVTAFR